MDFLELENKYIDLILKRCLNFEQSKSLMIHLDLKEHMPFALKIKERAESLGISDVCFDVCDLYEYHDYLKKTSLEDIDDNPLLNRSNWDLYAKKGGALLFINSDIPGLMSDIEIEKQNKATKIREKNCTYYRSNVTKYTFPWTIVAMPNLAWANSVFPNDSNAYQKLYLKIMKMCMLTEVDPILAWNEFILKSNYYKEKLNDLKITELHYQNGLGTDLHIFKNADASWINLDKTDQSGHTMIANMPSYEIFTSPDCRYTKGIVYSSRPLIFRGVVIDQFWLKFSDGKVVDFDAKIGKEALADLIYHHENANLLGEIALVECNSPIARTNLVFNTTLFDENASSHLALGQAYHLPIHGAEKMSKEELDKIGLNSSPVHVDFMIGTEDMNIEAETQYGRKLIFKQGRFYL